MQEGEVGAYAGSGVGVRNSEHSDYSGKTAAASSAEPGARGYGRA